MKCTWLTFYRNYANQRAGGDKTSAFAALYAGSVFTGGSLFSYVGETPTNQAEKSNKKKSKLPKAS